MWQDRALLEPPIQEVSRSFHPIIMAGRLLFKLDRASVPVDGRSSCTCTRLVLMIEAVHEGNWAIGGVVST